MSNRKPNAARKQPEPLDVTCTLFNGVRKRVVREYSVSWQGFVSERLPELLERTVLEPEDDSDEAWDTAKSSLAAFILAPVDRVRRNDTVGAHTALVIDIDAVPNDDRKAFLKQCKRWRCAVYESPSSCVRGNGHRLRVIAALAAAITPELVRAARRAFARDLGLDPWTSGVTKADAVSQPMFIGQIDGTRSRQSWTFDGAVWAPPADLEPDEPHTNIADGIATEAAFGPDVLPSVPDVLIQAIEPKRGQQRYGGRDLMRGWGGMCARKGYHLEAIATVVRDKIPTAAPNKRVDQALEAAQQWYSGDTRTAGPNAIKAHFCKALGDEPGERIGREVVVAIDTALRRPGEPEIWHGPFTEAHARDLVWWDAYLAKRGGRLGKVRVGNDVHPSDARREGCDPVVDGIITHLAPPSVGIFQRAGKLTIVTRDACTAGDLVRPIGTPTIRDLPLPRLKEAIRTTAGPRDVALAGEVMARGEWSDIRPLDAIVSYPVMRIDGTLLLSNGYDAATRTLAEMTVRVDVPNEPTRKDAQWAMARLGDLVCDFPFVNESQRSAWLAMLLTIPARPAINGPTPLGLLEASQRSSGKSLLADLIAVITTGEAAPRCVAPKTKEEWDKSLFTILLAGDPIVLFDNVTTMLVSDALDAVLTGTTYQQRLLGENEKRRIAIRTVFLVSANNARLSTDLVRRSLGCRLEPNVERPEARTGFRVPDLLGHARAKREELLSAVLTILRAYAVAGRPRVEARQMGSYENWCRVVRDALVWAGAADPALTQDALRESADVERDELRELLAAWRQAVGDRPVTARELIDAAYNAEDAEARASLLEALRGITPNGADPTSRMLGNKLRTLRGGIVGKLILQDAPKARGGFSRWRVQRM